MNMLLKWQSATLALLLAGSPALLVSAPAAAPAPLPFTALAEEFLRGYLAARPLLAVSLGLHEYDGKLPDLSDAAIRAENARLHEYREKLKALAPAASPAESIDRRILALGLEAEIFQIEKAEAFLKNPMTYVNAFDANVYLKRNFAPLPARLKSIIALEKQLPALFAAARANLAATLPKPMVELAIEQAQGQVEFLGHDLVEAVQTVSDAVLQAEFRAANATAIAEYASFASWLEKDHLPKADASFPLGRENYVAFLAVTEAITLSPEKILEIGAQELKREQAVLMEAAREIDPNQSPEKVIAAVKKEHPTAENLLPDTRKHLEAIRAFIIDRQIITVPSEVRVTLAETPSFARQYFASMDSPGPFEEQGAEAYYYVTPVDPKWTERQKEEWLTSFDTYSADVTSIHEAYPGHYIDFLHQRLAQTSKIEKIFTSYARTEGWAHYCEKMVIDEGYGQEGTGPAARLRAAKYRLAQSTESLLRICRLCASIQMHCQGMSVEEATKFFQRHAYAEEKPAHREALRGTFDPGYLFYTFGKLQILKLRADYQRQEGASYSLKKFHDAMCDHGAMPIRLLRELLLKDPASFEEIL